MSLSLDLLDEKREAARLRNWSYQQDVDILHIYMILAIHSVRGFLCRIFVSTTERWPSSNLEEYLGDFVEIYKY